MEKKKILFHAAEPDASDEFVDVRIPKSTYDLFHTIYEKEILSGAELQKVNKATADSMTVNEELYPTPEEYRNAEAPKGTFLPGILPDSVFFPDSPHPYWVYVPAAYNSEEPANLAVFLDAPLYTTNIKTQEPIPYPDVLNVFDNLIDSGSIPPTIVLFVSFGLKGPGQPLMGFNEGAVNRSLEYDTPSDRNARFLTEEAIPLALSQYSISDDPADHVIVGMSSSGIAAFTAAWFRPDFFGNVIMASPSFANIRSGIVWPSVIRLSEAKPVRIFAVVGRHDIDGPFGSWFAGSMDVAAALKYRQYDYRYYLSEAGHSIQVSRFILPQGLKWAFSGKEAQFERMERIL